MSLRRTLLLSTGSPSGDGAGEQGRIHIDGRFFKDEAGAIWPWRGTDGFTLYLFWLQGGAAKIDPLLANWFASCGNTPFNIVRVLGMVNSFAHLWPQEWPDYYDQLPRFMDHVWTRWALRVEFVIFADAQDIMPNEAEQDAHAQRVMALLQDPTEICNEPVKNIPGGDARTQQIYDRIKGPGRMIALGGSDYDRYMGDYGTMHTERSDDWPRKTHDLQDAIQSTGKPWVGDEPMGCAEVFIGGSRDTNPRNFADYASTAAMMSSGSTFHNDPGLYGLPMGPVVASCAKAFFAASWWIPPPVQAERFQRGAAACACCWTYAPGDAPSPCQHDDGIEVRSFGKILEPQCWVVQVQTQRFQPTACAGWQADQSGPSQGLTRFRRT